MNKYLDALEAAEISPNFWCSEEYFERAGWETFSNFGMTWVEDREGEVVLPALLRGSFAHKPWSVWSDLEGYSGHIQLRREFLDHNFIYDPRNFLKMEGGSWAVFRKNSRKFASRNPEKRLSYLDLNHIDGVLREDLPDILLSWLEGKPGEVIHGDDVMLDYVENGRNRKVLLDQLGNVYGVNIWDENYKYINFRFCICRPEPFLSEYMRLLFYTDREILEAGKLVNDGGALDNRDLADFKMKLNPVEVKDVFSWKKEERE